MRRVRVLPPERRLWRRRARRGVVLRRARGVRPRWRVPLTMSGKHKKLKETRSWGRSHGVQCPDVYRDSEIQKSAEKADFCILHLLFCLFIIFIHHVFRCVA